LEHPPDLLVFVLFTRVPPLFFFFGLFLSPPQLRWFAPRRERWPLPLATTPFAVGRPSQIGHFRVLASVLRPQLGS
ncbi:hypothetical protein, partial [Brevibacterium sp. NPDC058608]|uniref:hypothetical protein n=1 Tax=Brevibacterium sp. NPDC058608 TaxID=3346553 RepID=UPI00366609F5